MEVKDEDILAFDQSIAGYADKKAMEKLCKTQKPNRIQKRATAEKKCTSCGTTNTPVWRWGGEAKEVLLCNACSLRIRRSAGRPHRSKSPTESGLKHSPTVSPESGSPITGSLHADSGQAEREEMKAHLVRSSVDFHLNLEKARLLGGMTAAEGDWCALHKLNAFNNDTMRLPGQQPAMQYTKEWHYHQHPAILAELGRLEVPYTGFSHEPGMLPMY